MGAGTLLIGVNQWLICIKRGFMGAGNEVECVCGCVAWCFNEFGSILGIKGAADASK